MSFWYGLGFADICQMPMATIRHYLQRLPARQGEWRATLIESTSFPHQKESDRRRLIASLERATGSTRKARPASVAELALVGIGMELVRSNR